MRSTYAELHLAHHGKSSDKWESYLKTYERLFAPIRDARVTIVEVGVQNGGSLEVLASYFPNAEKIIGCDINEHCGTLRYADRRISVIVGDACSTEAYASIAVQAPVCDVFIDDGSHISSDVVATFANYFPLVRPGGIYIVEDTHALYWENWGGGVLRGSAAQHLFKLLTDVVNYEHWSGDLPLNTLLSSFFRKDAIPAFLAQGWVERVEFANSMIVVHKANEANHAKLGRRVVVGNEFCVEPETESLKAQPCAGEARR